MRNFLYRLCVFFTNLFFPPFAVCMVAGLGTDVLINICLLLLAIFPSHIHGFYLTCVYFHRRHKVKRGQYPGGPKSFIYSQSVLNGGFSDAVVEELYRRERGLPRHDHGSSVRHSYQYHGYADSQGSNRLSNQNRGSMVVPDKRYR